jgi:ATP-binding cassette subfamily F protein uup
MALVSGNKIQLAFGGDPIFDGLDFKIEPSERLCVLGRNGAGKSTFFKLLTKQLACDSGELNFQKNIKISLMDQSVPKAKDETCYEIIGSGMADDVGLLNKHQELLKKMDEQPENMDIFPELEKVQQTIEAQNLWEADHQIQKVASLLQIDPDEKFSALSGGRKRRAWLARALVNDPDILLLDEPTNHIDLETVLWLENMLLSWNGTIVFISHDRSFVSKLATRIIDIDRGTASSWPGDYQTYLVRKQESLEQEDKQNRLFDKKLAQEEVWIRQGIKARRTRNEGRVRALVALRNERNARREQQGQASFNISTADKSSKLVIEAKHLNFEFDEEHKILNDFSTLIVRGDKVGIIGPNGVGKSTLIKLLLGKLESQSGELKVADNLQVAYFDQLRELLSEDKNIIDNVAEGSDFIEIGDKRTHIITYLKDFLFSSERLRTPLSALSGGERNRVLLAKLFSKPSNFMVLDEPTNDLDIDTLELLEEKLLNYQGTLLLISHDRSFLNNIVTSTLVFEDNGVNEYVGGYDDWLLQRPNNDAADKNASSADLKQEQQEQQAHTKDVTNMPVKENEKKGARKLSFKEKHELELLPKQIEDLEKEIETIQQTLSDPTNYQNLSAIQASPQPSDKQTMTQLSERLTLAEQALEIAFERWSELEP